MSNRDANYYLEKAKLFYQRSKQNNLDGDSSYYYNPDKYLDNENDYEYIDNINDHEYNDYEPESLVTEEVIVTDLGIKPQYKRIYDPNTKHYYKVDHIFENKTIPIKTNTEVWYPANNFSYKTMFDPKTNRYYRINKTYDDKGKYSITHDKLIQKMTKVPGTSYYKPVYQMRQD